MSCIGFNGGVVMVIGGAGCLGQHIIKELQMSDFSEIRVFDSQPYVQKLDYAAVKPFVSVVGDIRQASEVQAALVGVSAVIHVAGIVDVGVFPNVELMRAVNVEGTRNVLNACLKLGISYLVFTSTVDVIIGYDNIINGDETLVTPEKLIYAGYGGTKLEAERLVQSANGKAFANGDDSFLRTLIIRPTVFYGECDKHYIPTVLASVKQSGGTLMRIGDRSLIMQSTYVGNVAWAHVSSLYALRADSQLGGAYYFITDDTPLTNGPDSFVPFLAPRGYRVTKFSVPYWLMYILFWIFELLLKIIKPIHAFKVGTSLAVMMYINRSYFFNRSLAEKKLNYKVKYTYSESVENSLGYYNKIAL